MHITAHLQCSRVGTSSAARAGFTECKVCCETVNVSLESMAMVQRTLDMHTLTHRTYSACCFSSLTMFHTLGMFSLLSFI